MDPSGELVFVYGTLRTGASNHWRMAGAESLGEAWVLGRLYPIDWYPGMVVDDDGVPVRGEVYRVDGAMLATLDEFEGIGTGEVDEYARVRVEAHLQSGEAVQVWAYDYRGSVKGRRAMVPADWVNPGPRQTAPVFVVMSAVLLVAGFFGVPLMTDLLELVFGVRGNEWIRVVLVLLHVVSIALCAHAAQWRNERWKSAVWVVFALAWVGGLGMGLYRW